MTGEALKKIITENGYTMASAARLLEMSPQHLNQALSAADVKSGLIEKAITALGLDLVNVYPQAKFTVKNDGTIALAAVTEKANHGNGGNLNTAVINRFLSIIEEKDRQIAQLLKLLDK
jgi:transcriptional regulator with XRE-family HTH domain